MRKLPRSATNQRIIFSIGWLRRQWKAMLIESLLFESFVYRRLDFGPRGLDFVPGGVYRAVCVLHGGARSVKIDTGRMGAGTNLSRLFDAKSRRSMSEERKRRRGKEGAASQHKRTGARALALRPKPECNSPPSCVVLQRQAARCGSALRGQGRQAPRKDDWIWHACLATR